MGQVSNRSTLWLWNFRSYKLQLWQLLCVYVQFTEYLVKEEVSSVFRNEVCWAWFEGTSCVV